MSTYSRVMRIPAARRAYSYFSSRSGGGRYFNSAKPPKAAVVAGKGGVPATSSKADSSVESKQTGVQCAPQPNNSVSASDTESTASSSASSQSSSSASDSSDNGDVTPRNQAPSVEGSLEPPQHRMPIQSISPKDFKMHQFFSLHRPLLLISQPSTLFREVPFNHTLLQRPPPSDADIHQGVMQAISGLGLPSFGTSDAFLLDADAEAARQLTRALTMTKASATVSWEGTLKTLGLDVSKESERVNLQEQFDKDWEEVMLDSTKRKRRKKMKKHKLKKRRRATRAERLRLK